MSSILIILLIFTSTCIGERRERGIGSGGADNVEAMAPHLFLTRKSALLRLHRLSFGVESSKLSHEKDILSHALLETLHGGDTRDGVVNAVPDALSSSALDVDTILEAWIMLPLRDGVLRRTWSRRHARCAVVGNAGTLEQRGYEIDHAYDAWFRFNYANVDDRRAHDGSHTTYMFVSPSYTSRHRRRGEQRSAQTMGTADADTTLVFTLHRMKGAILEALPALLVESHRPHTPRLRVLSPTLQHIVDSWLQRWTGGGGGGGDARRRHASVQLIGTVIAMLLCRHVSVFAYGSSGTTPFYSSIDYESEWRLLLNATDLDTFDVTRERMPGDAFNEQASLNRTFSSKSTPIAAPRQCASLMPSLRLQCAHLRLDSSSNVPPRIRTIQPKSLTLPHTPSSWSIPSTWYGGFQHLYNRLSLETNNQNRLIIASCNDEFAHIGPSSFLADVPAIIYEYCSDAPGVCAQRHEQAIVHAQNASMDVLEHRHALKNAITYHQCQHGAECASFLRFVTTYYEHLPDRLVFLRGDALASPQVLEKLKEIQYRLHRMDFVSLNAVGTSNLHLLSLNATHGAEHESEQQRLLWTRFILNDVLAVNRSTSSSIDAVAYYCCSQFVVSREAIRRRTLHTWTRLEALVNGSGTHGAEPNAPRLRGSLSLCAVFESIWHVIFGKRPVPKSSALKLQV